MKTSHTPGAAVERDDHYNFAYLDESTKRMLRRALLKAVAIPGYQVPFGSREMPLPYGWGTGGIQVTASIIGPGDVLKVIDQGSDDTTNAINIRRFFGRVTGVATTESTRDASIVQTRHRIPETPLRADQIMVFQVPIPEPLRWLEPSRPRPAPCTRWPNTAACTSSCTRTSPSTATSPPPTTIP